METLCWQVRQPSRGQGFGEGWAACGVSGGTARQERLLDLEWETKS